VVGALVASIDRGDDLLIDRLRQIQSRLFGAGAWLAVTPGSESASLLETFPREHVQWLENAIDEMDAQLPPLKHFILPGGCRASAYAHMARTVCRRAERHAVFALETETGTIADDENTKNVVAFLNRLSDFLFVLARYLNQLAGERDIVWKKR
jgi:cob(I)alamin adenosyltransferase